jgi:hypothetical protein
MKGDVEYLRILHLAASTLEADVEAALTRLLAEGAAISADAIKALVTTSARVEIPVLEPPLIDLSAYDALLTDTTRLAKVGT